MKVRILGAVAAGVVAAMMALPALADGDPDQGKRVFNKCKACHSFEDGAAHKIGPNLWGVIDRAVASVDGFNYSEALKEFGGKWELERLDEFLSDPAGTVPGHQANPGTRMPPSNVWNFPPRSGPAEPPWCFFCSHGPLSDVNTTRVFSSTPWVFRAARICPTDQSISSIVSP